MRPKRPMILPKTSTMRILTNRSGSAASARAAVEPAMPTEIPHSKLHAPTVRPPQNNAYPEWEGEYYTGYSLVLERTCEVVLARVEERLGHSSDAGRIYDANDLIART